MSRSTIRARVVLAALAFVVATVALLGVRAARAGAEPSQAPDKFDLRGMGVSVDYATTSFTGDPTLSYTQGGKTQNFRGDQIRTQETELGFLVTVTIAATPDLSTTTFTLVVPRVNLPQGQPVRIRTQGITTVSKTSIGGPDLVSGQVQTYQVTPLVGTASFVWF